MKTECGAILTDMRRLLSVKSGNPITIHDEDIGTTWPNAMVCRLGYHHRTLISDFLLSRTHQHRIRGHPSSSRITLNCRVS